MRRALLVHPDGASLLVLGAVQGLVAEADAVEDDLRAFAPRAVGIQLDDEQAAAAASWTPLKPDAPEDATYLAGLAVYGEVELPAPDLRRTAHVAAELGAELCGIDVSELVWVEEFTRRVSGLDLMRRAVRMRGGRRRLARAGSPELYADAWDARANRAPFDGLERWREREMAGHAAALARRAGPAAAVVEAARFKGVCAALAAEGFLEA